MRYLHHQIGQRWTKGDSFLFKPGGEALAGGQHPDGRAKRLAIDSPTAFACVLSAIQLPSGIASATSGQWVLGYRLVDQLCGHTIDIGTAEPFTGARRSVTVIAGDAMSPDGRATALCTCGAGARPELASSKHLAARFVIEAAGALRTVETGRFREFLT